MARATRSDFLKLATTSLSVPIFLGASPKSDKRHDFLSRLKADASERPANCQYRDECEAFESFMLSLANYTWTERWEIWRECNTDPVAVDFRSGSEEEAEATARTNWIVPFDVMIGHASTIADRVQINVQNRRFERHLTFFIPAVSKYDFWGDVTDWLNGYAQDERGDTITTRHWTLGDKLSVLSSRADRADVYLFSRWTPSRQLRAKDAETGTELIHFPLEVIPSADLEMNRFYHGWRGTESQAKEFRAALWTPSWQR